MLALVSRILPHFDFRIEVGTASDIGLVRGTNEDRLLHCPEHALFGVADGMGGHPGGEVAAEVALATVRAEISRPRAVATVNDYVQGPSLDARREVLALMRRVGVAANEAVLGARHGGPARDNMGTTLDVVLFAHSRAFFAHIGDSRAYLIRPTVTVQLTQDHVLHDTRRAPASATSPRRPAHNPLVNAIGLGAAVTVDTVFVDLSRGDRILLCSDGVHGAIESEAMLSRLCAKGTADEVAEGLIKHARERGGHDNATAIVVEICERFVKRGGDAGPSASDLTALSASPLLAGLPPPAVLGALAAGVEVELGPGERLPREVASDLVAYVILEGQVELRDGRRVGASGLVFPESLVGVRRKGELPVVRTATRMIRIRKDDFAEVCDHDRVLASALYRRLATFLASD
ncbi:Protein serine/threonine phosphatase PrpC, regulation of stationary phase [Chondromyces apiculatus DSM 436]|uniref:Protein serine/threonine phosphatase PrpC, regulation of stationary phase n=1 Tax=Chondromyces apiculatus DSM 436 TaxID=1192034 RepID=A0A017T6X4_9BACT|nr:Protein serine/threonine phosphatase PrpC, regulation of stationary phase [Chondromyces apiculatus DSM 436]